MFLFRFQVLSLLFPHARLVALSRSLARLPTFLFREHFNWYTFERRSRSPTIALKWWIVINIDVRSWGISSMKKCYRNERRQNDKECEEWDESVRRIIVWIKAFAFVGRDDAIRTLPISVSCSICFVRCCINNRVKNNYRRASELNDRSVVLSPPPPSLA